MTRSDVIRSANRFPAITVDLRRPQDPWTACTPTNSSVRPEHFIPKSDYAMASTWWNSIALFFGDVTALASAVVIGGFASYAIETYLLEAPYFALQGPYLARQLLLLPGAMVAICAGFAHARPCSERHPYREDLAAILNALLVGFVISGLVEFAYQTSFSRLWLLSTWLLAALATPLVRVIVRQMLTTGRQGGDARVGYEVPVGRPLSAYTKDPKAPSDVAR